MQSHERTPTSPVSNNELDANDNPQPDNIDQSRADGADRTHETEMLNPEAIRRLENLDLDADPENDDFRAISAPDKAAALLVAIGERPASLTDTWSEPWNIGDPPRKPHDSSAEYTDILYELGLHTSTVIEIMDALPDPTHPEVARFVAVRTVYMAKTEQALNALVNATGRQAIGQALGYPDTSIQAFANGDKLPISQLEGVDPALKAFNFFILSPDHYEAELAVAARWAAAVRQASPAIYEAATSSTK